MLMRIMCNCISQWRSWGLAPLPGQTPFDCSCPGSNCSDVIASPKLPPENSAPLWGWVPLPAVQSVAQLLVPSFLLPSDGFVCSLECHKFTRLCSTPGGAGSSDHWRSKGGPPGAPWSQQIVHGWRCVHHIAVPLSSVPGAFPPFQVCHWHFLLGMWIFYKKPRIPDWNFV